MVSKKAKAQLRLVGARRRDKSIHTLVGFGKFDKDGWLPLEHVVAGARVRQRPADMVDIEVRMSGVMQTIQTRTRNGLSDRELAQRALAELLGQTGGFELEWEEVPVAEATSAKPKPAGENAAVKAKPAAGAGEKE